MELYVVTMYRWGDREKHSYVLGVFANAVVATRHCAEEEIFRGGKYTGEILRMEANVSVHDAEPRVLKALPPPRFEGL